MKHQAAVFTIAQSEPYFLPKWVDYYSNHFRWPHSDLFILDHDSTDQSTRDLNPFVKVVPVHRTESFNHTWLRETVQAFQRFLLQSYECVLFTEVDELIISEIGLTETIETFATSNPLALRCRGVELVDRNGEQSAELSKWYNKVLLSKVPLTWCDGFHDLYQYYSEASQKTFIYDDPQLWLIHLHRENYQRCREKHRQTAARKWAAADVASGAGAHNRITSDAEFDKWFYRQDGPKVELPESIRNQL